MKFRHHKVVKHTQNYASAVSPTNCLSVFDPVVGLALKGLICWKFKWSSIYEKFAEALSQSNKLLSLTK